MTAFQPDDGHHMRPSEFVADQRSSDISDQASATEALFLQQAQALHALKVRQAQMEPPDEDEDGNRYCLDCGEQIPPQRLLAVPYAVRCVPCLSKRERRTRMAEQSRGFDNDEQPG